MFLVYGATWYMPATASFDERVANYIAARPDLTEDSPELRAALTASEGGGIIVGGMIAFIVAAIVWLSLDIFFFFTFASYANDYSRQEKKEKKRKEKEEA